MLVHALYSVYPGDLTAWCDYNLTTSLKKLKETEFPGYFKFLDTDTNTEVFSAYDYDRVTCPSCRQALDDNPF